MKINNSKFKARQRSEFLSPYTKYNLTKQTFAKADICKARSMEEMKERSFFAKEYWVPNRGCVLHLRKSDFERLGSLLFC